MVCDIRRTCDGGSIVAADNLKRCRMHLATHHHALDRKAALLKGLTVSCLKARGIHFNSN
ncbi:hypothetical protein BOSE62_71354 [Bosea sp. 62]|nr:hypothetical protein BOSE29B_80258 [Bosea sp. 29B]VXC90494.1 hypothetical protein BOSE62_71354 [Bosea sp. 62]